MVFLVLSGKFRCVFLLCLKSIRCVYRKLILKFVDDENNLHGGYVVVDCNILILLWVGNNFVHFLKSLL